MKGAIAKINKTKSWFFAMINKIDKPLATHQEKKRIRNKPIKLEIKMRNHNRQHRNTKDQKRLL